MPELLSYKFSRTGTLFFALHTAFKLDLGQFFRFVAAVKVFIFVGDVFILIAIIAQHAVLRVSANGIAAALRWEADLAKHAGVLVLFANHQAHLPVLHRQDSSCVAVATLHEVYQTVRQARFYAPDILSGGVAHKQAMAGDVQLYAVAHTNLRQRWSLGNIDEVGHTGLARLFNEEAWIDALGSRMRLRRFFLKLRETVQILFQDGVFRAVFQCLRIGLARLGKLPQLAMSLSQSIVRIGFKREQVQDILVRGDCFFPQAG